MKRLPENYTFTRKPTNDMVHIKMLKYILKNPCCTTKSLYEKALHYKRTPNGTYPTHGIISAMTKAHLIKVQKVKQYNTYFITKKGMARLAQVND